jgi:hypothetical protein
LRNSPSSITRIVAMCSSHPDDYILQADCIDEEVTP